MSRTFWLLCILAVAATTLQAQTPVVNAKKRTSAITIEGNPTESIWEFTNNVTKTIIGSPNNTVKYAVLWDSLNLYVAVTVTDATKFNDSPNPWEDDAAEIFIDADNNGGTSYGVNDRQFVKEWNSSSIWEKNNKTANIQHAWANITNGYAIEILIPWNSIGITNPAVGFTIGFDVANDDDENGGNRESQLMWAGDNDNWQYPRNFGDLVLISGDTQAPTAPTNLAASNATQTSVTLNWTPSADNVGVTGYDVYRNGTKINTSLVTATTYNVTGLTAATAYQFFVRARDAAGNTSANSNTLNITTPDTQSPTAPANLTATSLNQTSVTLSWTGSTDNVGVTGYNVFRDGIKINASLITTTTYNVAGLTGSTTYQFYVQASDAAGNTSNSNVLSVTTPAPPDNEAPTPPASLIALNITESSLTLDWDASTDNIGVTGYNVFRNGIKINSSLISATTYDVSGLSASTAYEFYVQAKDLAGNTSDNSNTINVTTPDTQAPAAPTNLATSNLSQTSLTLSWTASTDNIGVSGYNLFMDGIKINTSLISATTYDVIGLTASTNYQFYVQANDAAGNTSSNSNVLNVTTLASPDTEAPAPPANLIISNITQSSLTLNWDASTDNIGVTGYDLFRNGIKINSSPISATTYNVTGLSASTAYEFYVQAKDAAGNTSDNSNTVNVTTPDTQAPSAPADLTASSLTQSSLILSWTAAADNVGVTGYDIYQDNLKINSLPVTSTSYDVSGLVANTAYIFYVQAIDAAANTTNSGTLNVTTLPPPDTEAPTDPANLAASGITQTSLTLTWSASSDNVGVTGYDVYQNGTKINTIAITATIFNVTGLMQATSYNFFVKARDAAGNVSANSNTINVTTTDVQAPTAPTGLTSSNLTATSVTLSWTASTDNVGVTGYDVYQNGTKINTTLVTGITFNVTGLLQATSYSFFITALDAAGNVSANSNTINVTTPDVQAPTAPTGLASSNLTATSVTLSWTTSTDNVGVTGYDVYQNGTKINTTAITATIFNVTGLSQATSYSFFVKALDAAGNVSSNSNTINTTTEDAQDPTAPTGLTSSNLTATSVTLSWIASTDNVGVTGYDIYRNSVKINTTPVTATTFNATGLSQATSYSFFVRALDAAGNVSVNSNTINVTTTDVQAPTPPTGLTSSNLAATSVTLSWIASTDNVGVTGYDIYRNSVKINITPVTATTFNATGLSQATSYSFFVRALDAAGNVSANSNTINVTTTDVQAPTAPTGLTSSNLTATSVTLSWIASTDNVGVTGYDIYRNSVKINTTPVTATTFNATGLSQATPYSFFVRALDAAGNVSANSNTVNITTEDAQDPAAPTGLTSSNLTATSVTLSWNASTDNVGVTGYDIYQNSVKVNTTPVSATTFNVTGLSQATSYSFFVRALDAAGNVSANSNTINITTEDTQDPTVPTGLASSNLTSISVTLNWTASTDNVGVTGYDVYRNGTKINGSVVTATTYNVTGLTASTAYSFFVQARDAAGNTSGNSNTINITTPATTTCSGAGAINFQKWLNISGTSVSNLTSNANYPNNPGSSGTLTSFEIPSNSADNYGMRVYGYICPPATGSYTFWIASDDNSELWLSTTSSAANKQRIAFHTSWTLSREWNKFTTQKSAAITLTAGQLYYVEALMKDGDQGDNMAVGWAKPGQATTSPSEVIPGSQLIAQIADALAPTAPANLSATNIAQTSVTLTWTASTDNIGVAGYDVYRNGIKINTSLVSGTTYNVTGLTAVTTYSFTIIAKDAAGNSSASSAILNVTTLATSPGSETFTQRTIIANQRMPHDLVYGPDNNIWYTERFAGTVSFVNPATSAKTVVLSLGSKMVRGGGQDGLMGLTLHPQFRQGKPFAYISYTYQSTSSTMRKIRIERYTYDSIARTLGQPVTILENIPGSNDHNSARLDIGPDLKLYYTAGDMGAGQFENQTRPENAQILTIYEGKVLRLNTELISSSWIPADNPFTNAGQKTAVYSYGHRNAQGLVWGNVNGTDILYSSEHGPYSDDELNIIEAGRNYGWPKVVGFCDGNYNGRYIGGGWLGNEQTNCATLNVREPIRSLFPSANPPDSTSDNMSWPSTAPSGTEFYGSNAIPGWQNSLLVAELKKGAVARFKLSSDGLSIISDTINYFRGKGRFRDVVVSADGLRIYVACDSSGSTSGPTGGVTTTPANPGSILEFTYQPPSGARMMNQLIADTKVVNDVKDKSVDVYPNPASSYFIVYNYTSQQGRSIELIDLSGKTIKKQLAVNLTTRIEVGNIANGLYILKITDAKGNPIRTEKIIIQK